MYRPVGLKNRYPDEPREHIRGGVHTAWEEGADDMLEGLRDSGVRIITGQVMIIDGETIVAKHNTTLVIIPDEEGSK